MTLIGVVRGQPNATWATTRIFFFHIYGRSAKAYKLKISMTRSLAYPILKRYKIK